MELPETAAGMIEYAVEYHAHIFLVRFIEQFAQGLVAAQERVNVVIVVGVVTVIGCRCKDWREINGVCPKLLDGIKMFGHAAQVAAFESINGRRRIPRLEI